MLYCFFYGPSSHFNCSVLAQPDLTEELKQCIRRLGSGTTKAGEFGVLRVLIAYPAAPDLDTLANVAHSDPNGHPVASVDIASLVTDEVLSRAVLDSLAPKIASEAKQRKRKSDQQDGSPSKRQRTDTNGASKEKP
jgi:hypothetical protein